MGSAHWSHSWLRRPASARPAAADRRLLPASFIRVEPHHAVPARHRQVREAGVQAVHAHRAHGAALHSNRRDWGDGRQVTRLRRRCGSSPPENRSAPTSHKSRSSSRPPAAPTCRSMRPEARSSMLGAKAGWLVRQGVRAPTRSRQFHSRTCPAWSAVSSRQSSSSFTPYTHLHEALAGEHTWLRRACSTGPCHTAQLKTVPTAERGAYHPTLAHPISSPCSRWCALEATRQSTLQAAGLLLLLLAASAGCCRCRCRAAPRSGGSLGEGQAEGGPCCWCCWCCWTACGCSPVCCRGLLPGVCSPPPLLLPGHRL